MNYSDPEPPIMN